MPVIPEDSAMDEFINWDNAGEPAAGFVDMSFQNANFEDFDLALANVDGDDFSSAALDHFEQSNLGTGNVLARADPVSDADPVSLLVLWEIPDQPCGQCELGSYSCKRIQEGDYRGYCTSCVALRFKCSFGPAPASPPNPWPSLRRTRCEDVQPDVLHTKSAPDLTALTVISEAQDVSPEPPNLPKIGARFSRESVRVLKNWLSTHQRHPYPTEDEKSNLQKQTGLNKTQIANWLANARRRGKVQQTRSTSPSVHGLSGPMDIPKRRGTPASFESMNPLQRWANSPPENEPASVTAIASAISTTSFGSGQNSPYSFHYTDDSSCQSLCRESSASSIGTSQSSGGSFASAYSHQSRGSFGSFGSQQRGRRRRRRRTVPKPVNKKATVDAPLKTFQCTFCTETFRTKYDWNRHEQALHLSLERWICSPHGATRLESEGNQGSTCVFCGDSDPDGAHVESHNYAICQERTFEERQFYRKDHLRQHLRLVHNANFAPGMEKWRLTTAEIKSRCGFCGVVMTSWSARQNHLAEHFKSGESMETWKGDWGFEAPILNLVENSIAPYLIHDERNSSFPFEASQSAPETPRTAYDLIKLELAYFIENTGACTDDGLQLEACRIIVAAEVLSESPASQASWLRDLIMSSDDLALQAQLGPIRGKAECRMSRLQISGKTNIFEGCPLEQQLDEYVKARRVLGLTAMDSELQIKACNILSEMEESSNWPSEIVANFIVRKIYGSPKWLAAFRQRAHLPRLEDIEHEALRSQDPTSIDSSVNNYARLEHELAGFAKSQIAMGIVPSDDQLQSQARTLVYDFDDAWNQTAADHPVWLSAFKKRHIEQQDSEQITSSNSPLTLEALLSKPCRYKRRMDPSASAGPTRPSTGSVFAARNNPILAQNHTNTGNTFFLNGSNCHRRMVRELSRYVAAAMSSSPNNPNQHVPSDADLQHQARFVMYDDGDRWNTTVADNVEWLTRFKRSTGILPADGGPGLHEGKENWSITQPCALSTDNHDAAVLGDIASSTAPMTEAMQALIPLVDASKVDSGGINASPLPNVNVQVTEQELHDLLSDIGAFSPVDGANGNTATDSLGF